jgi:hypothetical protein
MGNSVKTKKICPKFLYVKFTIFLIFEKLNHIKQQLLLYNFYMSDLISYTVIKN